MVVMPFLEELEESVLCGDGAMGTLLLDRGVPTTRCFEELCVVQPELVAGVHREYLEAGARVIETNSFGANAIRLQRFGLESRAAEFNAAAAALAVREADGRAYVAGSVGPLGLSLSEARARGIDPEAVFREQLTALLDGGVELILFETFTDLEELELALRVRTALGGVPAVCQMSVGESGRLRSGQTIREALLQLHEQGAAMVGINCISGPGLAVKTLERFGIDAPLSAYPNAGKPYYQEGRYQYEATPDYFAEFAVKLAAQGARLIGGCCGTTPDHIAAVAKALAGRHPQRPERIQVETPDPTPTPSEPEEPSLLDMHAAGKTVIVTELDPPKSLKIGKYLRGARELIAAGTDAVTLADNSLAILRVSNLALGIRLKQEGILTILHISCRDRNLLGLQSELMGMASLGMRHVLPLTGDPAKVGDHPGASSVYDATSIQLIGIIKRMNEGYTQSGGPLRKEPNFVTGCTFNPNARNIDAQVKRLARKVDAGARFVMTQPVFDVELVQKTAEATRQFGIPIFMGIWPLLGERQANFLHNEVPGITIPDNIRERIAGKEKEEGAAEGMDIATEIAEASVELFRAAYLITPFTRYELTCELSRRLRKAETAAAPTAA